MIRKENEYRFLKAFAVVYCIDSSAGVCLNHIHLFAVATPLLYIYFILQLHRNYPQWASMLWGFFMGVVIDTFSNTPGVAAGALTLIAAVATFCPSTIHSEDSGDDFNQEWIPLAYHNTHGTLLYSPLYIM